MVTISIILTTRNRPQALDRSLSSIAQQNYTGEFETIVVDQSDAPCGPQAPVRDHFTYVEDTGRGLSRARNLGARRAQHQYLFFLDDDATLEPDCLAQIAERIEQYRCVCLCGAILCLEDRTPFSRYQKQDQHGHAIHRCNFNSCLGSALVIEKSVLEKIAYFDERFGAGRYFGGSEESDVVLRLLDEGYAVIYDARFVVLHPRTSPDAMDSQEWLDKHYHYGLGRGALLRKHFAKHPLWAILWLLYSTIAPSAVSVVNLLLFRTTQAGRYAYSVLGRIKGFIRFPQEP